MATPSTQATTPPSQNPSENTQVTPTNAQPGATPLSSPQEQQTVPSKNAPGQSAEGIQKQTNDQQSSRSEEGFSTSSRREMMQHGDFRGNARMNTETRQENRDRDFQDQPYHGAEFGVWATLAFLLLTTVGTAIVWSVWNGLNALQAKMQARCAKKAEQLSMK